MPFLTPSFLALFNQHYEKVLTHPTHSTDRNGKASQQIVTQVDVQREIIRVSSIFKYNIFSNLTYKSCGKSLNKIVFSPLKKSHQIELKHTNVCVILLLDNTQMIVLSLQQSRPTQAMLFMDLMACFQEEHRLQQYHHQQNKKK